MLAVPLLQEPCKVLFEDCKRLSKRGEEFERARVGHAFGYSLLLLRNGIPADGDVQHGKRNPVVQVRLGSRLSNVGQTFKLKAPSTCNGRKRPALSVMGN